MKTVLFLSTFGIDCSTKMNLGLHVNLAFLSSTTLVQMLAVWMRRWARAETEEENQTLVQRRNKHD